MFGGFYFGQAYFGDTGDPGTPPDPTVVLAADALSFTDWDATTAGIGQDETATLSESAVTVGLGVGNSSQLGADNIGLSESARTVGLNTGPPPPPITAFNSVIRWVDSVSSTAGVRMDLENSYWTVRFDATSTPTPQMEDQRSSSMLADGELISASVYKNRTVHLDLLLKAPTASIAATEIQRLQRELDRDTNVLMWQPDTRLPAWYFRTYRGPDVTSDLDFGLVLHQFQIAIEAESFALGERVDLGSMTVSFDPAAADNPCYLDLAGIKGDVDTPLYITTADTKFSARRIAMATRRRGTPANMRWYRHASTLSPAVDAAQSTGGQAQGASGAPIVKVNFATTPANTTRLSGTFPAATQGSADWAGTYRVFARLRLNINSVVNVQLATGTTVASRNQKVTLDQATAGSFITVDLGLVHLPVANAGRNAGYGPAHPVGGSTLYLLMERLSGTSTVDIDFMFLMPADEDYALVQFPQITNGSQAVMDGPNGDVYSQNQNGELEGPTGAVVPYADATLPSVSPSALTNRVFLLTGLEAGALTTPISGQAVVDLAYWPRYLLVRPVTT